MFLFHSGVQVKNITGGYNWINVFLEGYNSVMNCIKLVISAYNVAFLDVNDFSVRYYFFGLAGSGFSIICRQNK